MRSREVDAYLAGLYPDRREALSELRALVLDMVPDAVETMKYRMPTYEYQGSVLCAFASQKQYMSLYMNTGLVEQHRADLAGLSVGGKELHSFPKAGHASTGDGQDNAA